MSKVILPYTITFHNQGAKEWPISKLILTKKLQTHKHQKNSTRLTCTLKARQQ